MPWGVAGVRVTLVAGLAVTAGAAIMAAGALCSPRILAFPQGSLQHRSMRYSKMTCSHCGHRIELPGDQAGGAAACPKCSTTTAFSTGRKKPAGAIVFVILFILVIGWAGLACQRKADPDKQTKIQAEATPATKLNVVGAKATQEKADSPKKGDGAAQRAEKEKWDEMINFQLKVIDDNFPVQPDPPAMTMEPTPLD